MKNIEYNYVHTYIDTTYGARTMPKFLAFAEAATLATAAETELVGSTDDGWAGVYKSADKYYKIESGLPEHEGHYYVTEITLI